MDDQGWQVDGKRRQRALREDLSDRRCTQGSLDGIKLDAGNYDSSYRANDENSDRQPSNEATMEEQMPHS